MTDATALLENPARTESEPSAPRPPTTPRERQSPQTQNELEKIEDVRKLFGLTEKPSILDLEKTNRERKKTVDEYVEQKLAAMAKQRGGFIDNNKKSMSSFLDSKGMDKGNRAARFIAKQSMRMQGMQNADEILDVLMAKGPFGGELDFQNRKVVENLKTVSPRELDRGLDRLMTLSRHPLETDLASPKFMQAVKELSGVSVETFEKICQQLNQYTFLGSGDYPTDRKSADPDRNLIACLEVLKQGGLTKEQLKKMESAKRQMALVNKVMLSADGTTKAFGKYGRQVDVAAILESDLPRDLTDDFIFIAEDAVFRHLESQRKEDQKRPLDDDFFDKLPALTADGSLLKLKYLIERGLNGKSLYEEIGSSYSDERLRDSSTYLARLFDFYSQPAALEWSVLFEEILPFNPRYGGGWTWEEHQNMYRMRQELTDFAVVLHSLGLSYWGLNDLINAGNTNDMLVNLIQSRERIAVDNLPENKRVYAERVKQMLGFLSREGVDIPSSVNNNCQVMLFLARNQSEINQYLDLDGFLRADLLEQMFDGKIPTSDEEFRFWLDKLSSSELIPPQTFFRHLDTLSPPQLSKHLPSIEDIEKSPDISEVDRSWLLQAANLPFGLKQFLLANRERFGDVFQNGQPRPLFIEEACKKVSPWELVQILTDEAISTFSPQERSFWEFWKNQPEELMNYLGQMGVDKARQTYLKPDGYFDEKRLQGDFLKDSILTPEQITRWETLKTVFERLAFEDSDIRAMAYLRIAEALSTHTLTQGTEVEALTGLQQAFSQLYHGQMSELEKRAWSLLRKELPFTIDERLREEMRNQALAVEGLNPGSLSWVHQAVHNYVRAQTPDYARALKDWVVNGDEASRTVLQQLADFYTTESKPPAAFYTNEELRQRLLLPNQLGEIERLVRLTEDFYEVKPEKIGVELETLRRVLPASLVADLEKAQSELISAKEQRERSEMYVPFLKRAAGIREAILQLATAPGQDAGTKTHLLALDALVSGLFRSALPEYQDRFWEPRLKNGTTTGEEMRDALEILKSAVQSGILEGEIAGFAQSLGALDRVFELSPAGSVDNRALNIANLMLTLDRHALNQDWSQFNEIAKQEMVEMLKRMGYPEREAQKRAIMEDLVRFEKISYKFTLEPLLDLLLTAKTGQLNFDIPSSFTAILGDKVIEGQNSGNAEADSFLNRLTQNKIPGNLNEASDFLSKLGNSQEMQANQLCNLLVKGYYNPQTGQRKQTTLTLVGNRIELYPFSYYGADGVVMLIDGKRVENPVDKVKELFKEKIVPAMIHSLREGD